MKQSVAARSFVSKCMVFMVIDIPSRILDDRERPEKLAKIIFHHFVFSSPQTRPFSSDLLERVFN